jgi:AmmeMemoRadiSam system protein B
MAIRVPARAGTFYPDTPGECLAELRAGAVEIGELNPVHGACLGGVVPHAGWIYSGATALRTWVQLARTRPAPARVVLLGAVHVRGVHSPSLGSWDQWASPLGVCPVDGAFTGKLIHAGLARVQDGAHRMEHSIEVSVPMIQHLMPGAVLVPVALPPTLAACDFGRGLAALLQQDPVPTAVVASTDLTHYGQNHYDFAPAGPGEPGLQWSLANDQRILDLVAALDAEAIVAEALAHHNACGAGALAAAVACARALGAIRAEILEHTNSHLRRREGPATDFVGYASAVFVR